MNGKPILCLDFDGVCHRYTSGWQGAAVIPDEYVPGLFEFLELVKDEFEVQIFSSRSNQQGGREAMMAWFLTQRKLWRSRGNAPLKETPLSLDFPKEKPPALVTLDDRGLLFTGTWPTLDDLKNFKPWYLTERRSMSQTDPLFRVHRLNEGGMKNAQEIAEAFDTCLAKLRTLCPEGREFSIVKTKLEEASFFAKKSMANAGENQAAA